MHAFRERRIEQRGRARPNQSAEFRNNAGRASGLFAPGLDVADVDRKAIALLCPLHRQNVRRFSANIWKKDSTTNR